MLVKVSEKIVLIFVIFLLLSLVDITQYFSGENNPSVQAKERGKDFRSMHQKLRISQEKIYRIEIKAVTPEDHEFLRKMSLDCVQGEKIVCEVDGEQIRKLQTSGHEFSIIDKGIRVKKKPSDFSLILSSDTCAWDYNDTDYDIPDNDGWVYSDIQITGAPEGALVTTIDAGFIIIHPFIGDLYVDLTDEDIAIEYSLWNRQGGDADNIDTLVEGITDFAGEPVNQIWTLWAMDAAQADSGSIKYWEIYVWYNRGSVDGNVWYTNLDDSTYHPIQEIKVNVRDNVTQAILGETHTDENGDYQIDFDPTGNQVYCQIYFDNPAFTTIYDWDSSSPYYALTKKSNQIVGSYGGSYINFYFTSSDIYHKAAHIFDYIYMEREFVSDNYFSWTRPSITCWLDNDEDDLLSTYSPAYDDIYITNAQDGWHDETVLHEYAHAIHNWVYAGNVNWGGDYSEHYMNSVTDQNFAFAEGWAEFMSCIIPGDDPTRIIHNGGDMETNAWWMGQDGTNDDGSVVEGAVASALYDMQDDNYDVADEYNYKKGETANLYDQFSAIFRIFEERKPATIVDFANAWKNDISLSDYQKISMGAIFENHEIKYAYLAEYDLVPRKFSLCQNYPNTFNSHTIINYNIPSEGLVKLIIYNILGQKVKTCVNRTTTSGNHNYLWDGKDDNQENVASGIYIYNLTFGDKKCSKLMLLLK